MTASKREPVYLYNGDAYDGNIFLGTDVECNLCKAEFLLPEKVGAMSMDCPSCKVTLSYPEGASW